MLALTQASLSFAPAGVAPAGVARASVSMVKSEAMPFMDAPAALDGASHGSNRSRPSPRHYARSNLSGPFPCTPPDF